MNTDICDLKITHLDPFCLEQTIVKAWAGLAHLHYIILMVLILEF